MASIPPPIRPLPSHGSINNLRTSIEELKEQIRLHVHPTLFGQTFPPEELTPMWGTKKTNDLSDVDEIINSLKIIVNGVNEI